MADGLLSEARLRSTGFDRIIVMTLGIQRFENWCPIPTNADVYMQCRWLLNGGTIRRARHDS